MTERTCSIDGCERPLRARAMCVGHYQRFMKYGDPHKGGPLKIAGRRGCAIEGCDGKHYGRGWCNKHYKRWQKHGDPTKTLTLQAPTGEKLKWLRNAITIETDDCIEWPNQWAMTAGYGKLRYRGRDQLAHRVALILSGSEPPSDSHQAAHAAVVCHNPGCVNLRHLRWATPKENNDDKYADGTRQIGTRSPAHKLTDSEVLEIVGLASKGFSNREIGRRFGVDAGTIYWILKGKSWGWLTGIASVNR